MVAIATAAIIAGNNSLIDIGQFAQALHQNQLRSLGASRDSHTGKYIAPSETTLRRVLPRLAPTQLDGIITDWMRSHLQDLGLAALAGDGKCARTAANAYFGVVRTPIPKSIRTALPAAIRTVFPGPNWVSEMVRNGRSGVE